MAGRLMVHGVIEPMLSEHAQRVLEARYLRRDEHRRLIETPEQLFQRVAAAVATAEQQWDDTHQAARWEETFFHMLSSLDFLPNSPALMNAGLPNGQLSACFVLPVGDTMEEIFEAIKQMALIQRTGGGTGFSFSQLRPKGDLVATTGGEASGPVSFMRIFDAATEHIKQGGRRRGANMGVLRVDHPDILEFIRAKRDGASLRNVNLSVGVTDAFMVAAKRTDFYALVHPRTGRPAGKLQADRVFEEIAQAAWQTGDPGLLFLDAVNRANPTPQLGAIEATNPCGEIPLLPYESCNLGSLNLANFLCERNGHYGMDWARLREAVRHAVRFLDDMIEATTYPIPEIARASRGTRKIGLGVMGFAEALIRAGVSYVSGEAVVRADQIMRMIAEEARAASKALAEARGVFPSWTGSAYARDGIKLRNATRTAIAPTGTISMIAGTSAGIEPLFALAYRRTNVLDGRTLPELNPVFLEYLKHSGVDADRLTGEVLQQGSLTTVAAAPDDMKRLFVTALEIPVDQHLRIQAAFQRHVDSAVSKTINLPRETTIQDVAHAYRKAWELGLKGITIFRYGSKGAQVLELGVGEERQHYEHVSKCDPEECRL
jgi:ribonucleoside-diphosphate reductase alpha chain